MKIENIKALIFDWGDTIMRDFPEKPGPMHTWDKVEWIPGAENLLKTVSKNFIMVIATNAGASDTVAMIKALRRVGADKYFSHFYSSKELGYDKPDVRFFTVIAEHIGITPEHCLMTGNLYEKDIVGAKASGMKTVLFNEKKSEGDFSQADAVIHSMEELISLLG
ncbi:MAG TPA: HAD family hydrolase [Bacteroidales bacterium]|nr:HAD family hydrolase [Bacteroidales bacterium]HNZ43060.1 HAD family hydrolase [Bacteroidales bacterium]HOH83496.1 HAD family hydrolase [Bacteroidales bacterium]HPB25849.1 HAD family hydrolase [Bacteroidales bacterium]HPI30394.1 HAD family hydrolase [Bacteroidales bacterium]